MRCPRLWVLTGLLWLGVPALTMAWALLLRVFAASRLPHDRSAGWGPVLARDAQATVVSLTNFGLGDVSLPVLLAVGLGAVVRDVAGARWRGVWWTGMWLGVVSLVLAGESAVCRTWLARATGQPAIGWRRCAEMWASGAGALVLSGVLGVMLGGLLRRRLWRGLGLLAWIAAEQALVGVWADGSGGNPGLFLPLNLARAAGGSRLESTPAQGMIVGLAAGPAWLCLMALAGWMVVVVAATGLVRPGRTTVAAPK